MQVIGDRQVRVVPDVAVSGSSNGGGLIDGLMSMMLWNQSKGVQGNEGHNSQPSLVKGQFVEEVRNEE